MIASLLAAYLLCTAQMPEWSYFKDGDGNSYYIDKNGKIILTDIDGRLYKPVTVKGLDYYTALADELISSHKPEEGLRILKSILLIPRDDQRIIDAGKKASASLKVLKRKHGERFSEMNRTASPALYVFNGSTYIVNDTMGYSISTKYIPSVIRSRWRSDVNYLYNGLLVGFKISKTEGGQDFLAAVDSEIFAAKPRNIKQLEYKWMDRLKWDVGRRTLVSSDESKVIYWFSGSSIAGFEAVIKNGKIGYCLKVVAPVGRFASLESAMKNTVEHFSVSVGYQSK